MKPPFSLTLTAVVTALTALGVNELLKLRDDQQVLRRLVETTARHQHTQSEISGSLVRVASNTVDRMDDLSRRVSVLELRPSQTLPLPFYQGPLMGTNYQWFTLPTNPSIGPFPLLHTNWVGTNSVTNLVLTDTWLTAEGSINDWVSSGGTNSSVSINGHRHRWQPGTGLPIARGLALIESRRYPMGWNGLIHHCEVCGLIEESFDGAKTWRAIYERGYEQLRDDVEAPHGAIRDLFSRCLTNGYLCSIAGHRLQVVDDRHVNLRMRDQRGVCELCGASATRTLTDWR